LNSNFTAIDTGASLDSVKPSSVRTKGFEPIKNEPTNSPSKSVEKITPSNLELSKRNVLKSQLEEKLSLLHKGPLGLMKPNSGAVPTVSDINKALNKETPAEISKTGEVKGILKKEGSFETSKMEVDKTAIQSYDLVVESVIETEESTGEGVESSGDNLDDSDDGLLESTEESRGSGDAPPAKRTSKSKRRFNRDRKMEQER